MNTHPTTQPQPRCPHEGCQAIIQIDSGIPTKRGLLSFMCRKCLKGLLKCPLCDKCVVVRRRPNLERHYDTHYTTKRNRKVFESEYSTNTDNGNEDNNMDYADDNQKIASRHVGNGGQKFDTDCIQFVNTEARVENGVNQTDEQIPDINLSGFSKTSRLFFESEQKVKGGGRRRIIAAAFQENANTDSFACEEETDYHFLAYSVAKLLPQSKLHLLEKLLFETRNMQFDQEKYISRPPYLDGELSKYYFKNSYSILNQIPCEDTQFIDGHPYLSPVEKVS